MTPQEKLAAVGVFIEQMDMLHEDFHRYSDGHKDYPFAVVRESVTAALNQYAEVRTLLSEHGGGGEAAPFGKAMSAALTPPAAAPRVECHASEDGKHSETEESPGWCEHCSEQIDTPAASEDGLPERIQYVICKLQEHGAKADARRRARAGHGDGVPSHTAMLVGEAVDLIRRLAASGQGVEVATGMFAVYPQATDRATFLYFNGKGDVPVGEEVRIVAPTQEKGNG